MKIEEKDKKGKLTLNTLTALITVTMYSVAKKTANSHFSLDVVAKTTLPVSAGGLVITILGPVVYLSLHIGIGGLTGTTVGFRDYTCCCPLP